MTMKLDFEDVTWGDSVEKLKCTECGNFLSYFPIYLSKEETSICGRCYDAILEKNNYVHNAVYETVAQFLTFPCCYQNEGCQEKFLPADMPEHENTCIYRPLNCPFNCNWQGTHSNFISHCNEKHSDLKLKNGEFVINLAKSQDSNNFLELDAILLIISYKFHVTNKLLELSICNVGSKNPTHSCIVHLTTENRKAIVQCNTSAFPEKKVNEVCLNLLKGGVANVPLVSCKISLEDRNEEVKIETVDRDLLSTLKCASCHNYEMTPIYIRTYEDIDGELRKEIICKECRDRYEYLDETLESLPNLDDLSNLLNYPCKNETNGCTFIGKPQVMEVHKNVCPYNERVCPMRKYNHCKWSGLLKNVATHVQDAHKDLFKEMSSEIIETISDLKKGKSYFIKYHEKVFPVEFVLKNDKLLYWSVHMLGQPKNVFSHEFEIMNSNKTKCFMAKKLCSCWGVDDQVDFVDINVINTSSDTQVILKIKILEN